MLSNAALFDHKVVRFVTQTTETHREVPLLRMCSLPFFQRCGLSSPGLLHPQPAGHYGFSYDLSGVLQSCQSIREPAGSAGRSFLPVYLGRSGHTDHCGMDGGRLLILASAWGPPSC
jgi:hypothetical protein